MIHQITHEHYAEFPIWFASDGQFFVPPNMTSNIVQKIGYVGYKKALLMRQSLNGVNGLILLVRAEIIRKNI